MTPLERYRQDLAEGHLQPDAAQRRAMEQVQALYDELLRQQRLALPLRWWQRLRGGRARIRGLYLYGGVGRGKTYIMDMLYECLPLERKLRTHFHRFMQQVHQELTTLRGRSDPLVIVARRFAERARVICFDEFFVSDIGDAMLLGNLLRYLFDEGVVLVATSNSHPDQLYAGGLQRERFLPAIELLHTHTCIVELDSGIDYRLRSLRRTRMYHTPLGPAADAALEAGFQALMPAHAQVEENAVITVLGRSIRVRRVADDVVWFDFAALCEGPRSAHDYIELAREFHALVLSDVPRMDSDHDAAMRRFISLVDELYDRRVKLILSAEVPMGELYGGHDLAGIFERTLSRLLEMQSDAYLASPHRP